MIRKLLRVSIGIFILYCFSLGLIACGKPANQKTIGIIVPIQHKALDEIVAGFTSTVQQTLPDIKFKIANAEADLNLERSIMQQMKDQQVDIVVPIGLGATQMALSTIRNQPILSIAANFKETQRQELSACNIAVVNDEIDVSLLMKFLKAAYPALSRILLIHSAEDKIFSEVAAAVAAGKTYGLLITPKLVPTLNDLYSIANNIPLDTQAILILKDNIMASGVGTLVHMSERLNIPLITSDQGSVQDGALFALGVPERNIGVEGAKLAIDIIKGAKPCELPIVQMKNLTIFINQTTAQKEKVDLTALKQAAAQLNYHLVWLSPPGGRARHA